MAVSGLYNSEDGTRHGIYSLGSRLPHGKQETLWKEDSALVHSSKQRVPLGHDRLFHHLPGLISKNHGVELGQALPWASCLDNRYLESSLENARLRRKLNKLRLRVTYKCLTLLDLSFYEINQDQNVPLSWERIGLRQDPRSEKMAIRSDK